MRPRLSFCMLTWNREAMLRQVVAAFFDSVSGELEYELIIMDNASTDGTADFLDTLKAHPKVRIIKSTKNLRLNAYKKLFAAARGEFIVDLDDDVIEFPKNFDKAIVEYFAVYPDYGYLCLNVVQNEFTNGHKPGVECYRDDVRGDKVVEEGPVGGWCAAFKRSHYRWFKFFFNRMNLSITRSEDGVLSGFLKVVLRQRQGVIKKVTCLHATGPYYANRYGLVNREIEKYQVVNCVVGVEEFSAYGK